MEMRGQFHAPAALLSRKEPPVPLDGTQSRSGRGGEEENDRVVTLQCLHAWKETGMGQSDLDLTAYMPDNNEMTTTT
jgi:hypothetical protein